LVFTQDLNLKSQNSHIKEKEMAKEVMEVEKTSNVPVVLDDSLLDQGTGLEDTTSQDYAIPFLQILQAGSPQLNKNEGKYVEGANQSDILNTVDNTVSEEIIVVPCYYQKKYIEWAPRETKGGLVNTHLERDILAECTRNEKNQYVLKNGNYIAETAHFYVLVTDSSEQEWSQAVIAMSSTQLSKARKWLSQMRQRKIKTTKGAMVNAPTFLFKYKLKTVAERNDLGNWYGWVIGLEGQVTNTALANEGASFLKAIKAGEVQAKEPTEEDSQDAAPF
jgi:hypothetical protein